MSFELLIDSSELGELTQRKLKGVMSQSNRRALNRALSPIRTLAIRIARDELGLKRKDALRRLFINQATTSRPEASLKISGRPLPLAFFSPRPKTVRLNSGKGQRPKSRVGVTALIGGTRTIVPGGFLAQLKSGKTGVFQRVGSRRLPIKEMKTDQLVKVFEQGSVFRSIREEMLSRYGREYDSAFSFYLARARGSGVR